MYNDCMGLLSIIAAYKLGKRKNSRHEVEQERDERLALRQQADLCFRCGLPYISHKRENWYRCPR